MTNVQNDNRVSDRLDEINMVAAEHSLEIWKLEESRPAFPKLNATRMTNV